MAAKPHVDSTKCIQTCSINCITIIRKLTSEINIQQLEDKKCRQGRNQTCQKGTGSGRRSSKENSETETWSSVVVRRRKAATETEKWSPDVGRTQRDRNGELVAFASEWSSSPMRRSAGVAAERRKWGRRSNKPERKWRKTDRF
ncbi:hypothetical protein LXL04_017199 [Taraxacum kok-saghyz]